MPSINALQPPASFRRQKGGAVLLQHPDFQQTETVADPRLTKAAFVRTKNMLLLSNPQLLNSRMIWMNRMNRMNRRAPRRPPKATSSDVYPAPPTILEILVLSTPRQSAIVAQVGILPAAMAGHHCVASLFSM
ncbi:hypothetical protein P154DRAFT_577429 [Amniculicola lignicola CBS 123094]|uniref:Uncharacterized protein n=1 Tax=Amniculicola lignicola CBS 123094 TaxID=1392246 RepID=A0A6A5WAV8_9PLEO|nr:hypothetical protein P154DRAFT_577429 [Amniculicola lignicola CBS 123094]